MHAVIPYINLTVYSRQPVYSSVLTAQILYENTTAFAVYVYIYDNRLFLTDTKIVFHYISKIIFNLQNRVKYWISSFQL